MLTFIIALVAICYLVLAMATKAYFKLYRWDHLLGGDPYVIGLFWPIYWLYRLIAWPVIIGSEFFESKMQIFESKMESFVEARKAKQDQIKARVPAYDREMYEAEQEIEEMLAQEERQNHYES